MSVKYTPNFRAGHILCLEFRLTYSKSDIRDDTTRSQAGPQSTHDYSIVENIVFLYCTITFYDCHSCHIVSYAVVFPVAALWGGK